MTFEEFETANSKQLRSEARICFQASMEMAGGAWERRTAKLLEAQFFMQELDRREDSWIARRDFWLEVAVIILILVEILLSIYGIKLAVKQGNDEDAMMGKQNAILFDLQTSTQATAQLLKEELALEYTLSVNVEYNGGAVVTLYNNSRSQVILAGVKFGGMLPKIKLSGQTIIPDHNQLALDVNDYNPQLIGQLQRVNPSPVAFPVELYFKNTPGEEFVWRGTLTLGKASGNLSGKPGGTLVKQPWSQSVTISPIP
jgi:hypothetical protein